MALFLLNCSVDTTGLFVDTPVNQHLIVNEQESIIEIVIEQFLGFENLIPETTDDETSQTANLKKAKVTDIFIIPYFSLAAPIITLNYNKTEVFIATNKWNRFHFKIPSPPPEI
ncbi:MAG: hypothetical protein V4546_13675 [Bacteroidota bacterium]